jgi:hypothetical protein
MHGLYMQVMDDHIEAVITDDVDDDWQLKDVHATLFPVLARLAAIDFQLTEALKDTQ